MTVELLEPNSLEEYEGKPPILLIERTIVVFVIVDRLNRVVLRTELKKHYRIPDDVNVLYAYNYYGEIHLYLRGTERALSRFRHLFIYYCQKSIYNWEQIFPVNNDPKDISVISKKVNKNMLTSSAL
jgi:hypothetical protein